MLYRSGTITKTEEKTWLAYIRIEGKRHRSRHATQELAKHWIDQLLTATDLQTTPLTAGQLMDAARALQLLPPGTTLTEAATHYLEAKQGPGITIEDAFTATLALANRKSDSHTHFQQTANRFMAWLAATHPTITQWSHLTRAHLRQYLATHNGKSANHKRLMLQPIQQTARHMHHEHKCANIGERLGIGNKLKTTPTPVYLENVIEFLTWATHHAPHLEAGIALQSLAGLQLQEALRLSWENVDLQNGLIQITGEVKNPYRNRLIPICNRTQQALQQTQTKFVIRHSSFIILTPTGLPYCDFKNYGRNIRRALLQWNPKTTWTPKDLRNTLPTFAKTTGIHNTLWEQYIGHAPQGVTERHYMPQLSAGTTGDQKETTRQMNLFREAIIKPLECALSQLRPNSETGTPEKTT